MLRPALLVAVLAAMLGAVGSTAAATTVKGYIKDSSGKPLSEVSVTFTYGYDVFGKPQGSPCLTSATGLYTFTATKTGYYQIKPVYLGKTYYVQPQYIDILKQPSVTFPDFTILAQPHKVFGYVKSKDSSPLPSSGLKAQIKLASSEIGTVQVSAKGYYESVGTVTRSGLYSATVGMTVGGTNKSIHAPVEFNVDIAKSATQVPDIIVDLGTSSYKITGTVRDKKTGQTLDGAEVSAMSLDGYGTTSKTAGGGRYTCSGLPAGKDYDMVVMKPNYSMGLLKVTSLSQDKVQDFELDPVLCDLSPCALSFTPTACLPGASVNVTAAVLNAGIHNHGAFSVGIYASADAADSISLEDIYLGNIGSGATGIAPSKTPPISGALSTQGLSNGQYHLKARVDQGQIWPDEYRDNNVRASTGVLIVGPPPGAGTRYVKNSVAPEEARFKIDGVFIGEDGAQYDVKPNATINEIIPMPFPMVAHNGSNAKLEVIGGKLMLDTSGIAGLDIDQITLLQINLLTIRESDGRVAELDGLMGKVFELPPGFFMELKELSIAKWDDGAISAGVNVALPLTKSAIKEAHRKRSSNVFNPRSDKWFYVDAETTFGKDKFNGTISIENSKPIFGGALLISSAEGEINVEPGNKYLLLSGEAELKRLCSGTTITLDKLELLDYYKPNAIGVTVETNKPLVIVPFPPPPFGPPIPGISTVAVDMLHVEVNNIFTRGEDQNLQFGGDIGAVIGHVRVGNKGALKAVRATCGGWVEPEPGDFGLRGTLALCQYKGSPKDFEGFPLLSAELDFINSERKIAGEADVKLLDILKDARGEFTFRTDANTLTGSGKGKLVVLSRFSGNWTIADFSKRLPSVVATRSIVRF